MENLAIRIRQIRRILSLSLHYHNKKVLDTQRLRRLEDHRS